MSSDPTYYRLSRAVHFGEHVFLRFSTGGGAEKHLHLTAEHFADMLAALNRLTKAAPLDFLAMQAATPAEGNETFHVPSAIAALTKRVRALEERAEPKAASPFSFGDDGKLHVSPQVIPTMRAAEQSAAAASVVDIDKVTIGEGPDWTATHDFASGETRFESRPADKPVPAASELYDEATRITTEPAANLLARLAELEAAVSTLQASVDTMQDDISSIRGTIEAVERALGEINAVFYGNEPSRDSTQGQQS